MMFSGLHHIHTTAYHPQSNGLAERTIQAIKKSLKTLSEDSNWYFLLLLTMLAFHAQVKEDLDSTVKEIMFGTELRLPRNFFTKTQKQTKPTLKFVETQRIFLPKNKYRRPRFPVQHKTCVDPNSTNADMCLTEMILLAHHYNLHMMVHLK